MGNKRVDGALGNCVCAPKCGGPGVRESHDFVAPTDVSPQCYIITTNVGITTESPNTPEGFAIGEGKGGLSQ